VPQEARFRRSVQEPRGGFAGAFAQRCLTKRSLENAVKAKFAEDPFQLDFSHLRAKGVGYARHQSPLKEVIEICVPYLPRWYRR
jgi:hypothetical protein